jgi:hypothetical protein
MAAPSPRRRFQFRLRTLMIVVTMLAVPMSYVGWKLKIIRERRETVAKQSAFPAAPQIGARGLWTHPKTPWPLGWLGEDGYAYIFLDDSAAPDEVGRVKLLFPEATVVQATKRR